MAAPRIALIHALRLSPPPIMEAFRRLWPEPVLMNLLDDSLSADLARDGALTTAMTQRFLDLASYARRTGADAILFTCSAFGPCIEAVKAALPIPVLKPNEAMIEEALGAGPRIGLVASFRPTFPSMRPEFEEAAALRGMRLSLVESFAEGAMEAQAAGRREEAMERIAEAAARCRDCDAVVLAQFSLAFAREASAEASGRPVYTTPDAAVRRMRGLLAA